MLFVCPLEDIFLPSYLSSPWENVVCSEILANQEFTERANWTEKGDLITPKIWDWIIEPVRNRITNSNSLLYFLVKNIIDQLEVGKSNLNSGECIQ